ncbi:SH3-like domain-containing protein [Streptomyces sp. V1I6]|nr:SH3-like domain-containing protein [Streptomyces sp. V1I6]
MQTTTTRRRVGIAVATVLMGAAGSIAAVPPAATAAEMPCKPRVYYEINSNGVNFRTGPSTAYKSKGCCTGPIGGRRSPPAAPGSS